MRVIDIHTHLADPAWQAFDPLLRASATAYGLVRESLPAGVRAAVDAVGDAARPVHRRARDGAIGLLSRAFAASRNRVVYLGARVGGALAESAFPLMSASFLRATPENLLAAMDEARIDTACVLPVAPHTSTELALSLCQSPRLIAFASIAPRTEHIAEKLEGYRAQGCRGVKIHPTLQSEPPHSPFYHELAAAAGALDMPIIAHTGALCYHGFPHGDWSSARAFEPLLRDHPRTRFVLAHMNLFEPEEAFEIARVHRNAWLDTSWQPEGVVRRAVRVVGDERIVFGSDWPFLGAELKSSLAIVERALDGRPDALENVLWRNAARLLGLDG